MTTKKKRKPAAKPPTKRICRFCGKPGARTIIAFGYAHKRCL